MTQTKEQTPNVDVTATHAEFLHDRIRAARDAFVADRSRRSQPFTDAAQLDFLALLSVGMPITEIVAMLGVASSTIYYRRHTDPEFAQQWALAVEMRYTHLEDRLNEVAMTCPIESMAGVRAAEILLKANNPRYRPDPRPDRLAPQPQRFPHGLGVSPTPDYPDRGLPPNWQPPANEPLRFPAAINGAASRRAESLLSTQYPALSTGAAAPAPFLATTQGGKSARSASGKANPKSPIQNPKSPWSLRRRLATA